MKLTAEEIASMRENGCGCICEGCSDDIDESERPPQEPIPPRRCIPHTKLGCNRC